MTDIVGAVAYDVIAEFDDSAFHEKLATSLERARDDYGRFVKEHRTISQSMMRDFGTILGSGTSDAMSVITKNMGKAADAAGKGFTARIGAALKSVPKSAAEALSTGAIGVITSAGERLGQHVSEAVADRIQASAPFWKKSFTQAFTQAADVNTTATLAKLADKIKGGGDNAGKSFQEALGDRFSKAGIVASSKLGNFAAQIANKIIPGSQQTGEMGVRSMLQSFQEKLPTGLKIAAGVAAGGAVLAMISKFRPGGRKAADEAAAGMQDGAKSGGAAGARALIASFGAALKSGAGSIVSAASAAGKAAAATMGDALKLGANVAGTAVAGILGTSLAKGFGRLKAIDNAQASLRGLASTAAHVPEIMNAVDAAMTGTAFGLDQGAKAAAQFAAAGVPLQDMQRHLGALANTAAAAGGDFDGVAGIFSKVAAGGKVTGEVLNQLTDRGLAALPALASELNVTAEEAQKMVSSGQVSFDTFSRAMDAAMGATAIEQASTFSGLISNLGAAMGRLGQRLQQPLFDSAKAVLPGVINLFDQLGKSIRPLAEAVGNALLPAAEKLGKALSLVKLGPVSTTAQELAGSLGVLAPVLGGVAALFAGPLLSSIPVVGGLFSGLTGPVGVLAGALIALFAIKPETMLAGFDSIMATLPGILDTIVAKVTGIVPQMVTRLAQNAPILLNGFAQLISQVAGAIGAMAPTLIPAAVNMVLTLASAILNALPALVQAGLDMVVGIADGLVAALPVLIAAVPKMVSSFLGALTGALPKIIESGIDIVLGLVDGVLAAIPQLVRAIPKLIKSLLGALVSALPSIIEGGIQLIDGLVTGIVESLPLIIDAIVEAIPMLLQALITTLPQLIQGGIKLVIGLVTGIVRAIPQIITAVVNAIPTLITALVETLPLLIQGGIQMVIGLVTGIIEAIPQLIAAVIQAIPQIIGALIQAIPQLVIGGIQLIVGLIGGVIQAIPQIVSAVVGLIPAVIEGLAGAFPGVTQFFAQAWANISTTITNVWNGVVAFFGTVWTRITSGIQTAWTAIQLWFASMFATITQTARDIWNGLIGFFTGLWDTIRFATQFAWNNLTSWLRSIFQGAINNARAIWNGLTSFFSGLWNGITKTFNTFLGFVKTKPKEAFQNAVDAIGRVWKGIQELAKKPVRFVIETVINGLIGTINKLPGVNIAKVPLPPGFARGGVIPGYRAAKRDDQLIPMRSGEGVLVPEVVRGLGPGFVHTLNAIGNSGGVSGVRKAFSSGLPIGEGRALGGLITPLPKDTWTLSQPYHGGHNGIDMAAPSGTKILAAADGIVQMAQAVNMGGNEIYIAHKRLATRYSHLSAFNVAAGSMVKQGQVIGRVGATGMATGPHLHYMVHNPNDGGNGRGYANHVNPSPYIGTYGQAFDGFDIVAGLMSFATETFRRAFPGGGMWVDVAGGILGAGVEQLTGWGKSLLGEDSDDRGHTGSSLHYGAPKPKLFDRGGWLEDGDIGTNRSGKPEAVFTNEESMAMKRLLAGEGRSIVFEAGAIVVQSAESAERTSIAVLDRIAEELEV